MAEPNYSAQRVHHCAIVVSDIEEGLRFWRDGLGLRPLMDQTFDGDWPALFGAPSERLRSIFLGDPGHPDAGLVELVRFDGPVGEGQGPRPVPSTGFLLLSFYVDLDATAQRLEAAGFPLANAIAVDGRAGKTRMATVHAPDGMLVELIDQPGR
jgi:glyoxylase I family protein